MGLKMKHKIVRKAREQKRKMKKEIKRMRQLGVFKKRRKKVSLPNLFPHKIKIIEKLERRK